MIQQFNSSTERNRLVQPVQLLRSVQDATKTVPIHAHANLG
jgi:hypothetical protein